MAQIIRAAHLGFCFGVRDALEAAERLEHPEQVTVYGELVHNADVSRRLIERRFETMREAEREVIPSRPMVMITAHGISQTRRQNLIDAGKRLIDTTCPLVQRAHDAASMLAERGHFVVVIGSDQHVEVLGIIEDLPEGRWAVVATASEVVRYNADQIGIVSQTTMPDGIAEQCREAIAAKNPQASIRWINTICRPTRQRQTAVDQLCEQVEIIIVVGGINSNNTRRLVERCQAHQRTVYHIQTHLDIKADWLEGIDRIGLTAGTSTPDSTIDRVEEHLRALTYPTCQ
jgi:4-hydroxy-3-methylbut-2-en-1-yl diphosphate reductase